ncbi:MAG: ABC transporter ATP-binding protein [Pseudomonadota bacterium]
MMPLDCKAVSVVLGHKTVLDRITLRVDTPALIGIVGPNGAGKSTLMRAMAGLQSCSGSIAWDDVPLSRMPEVQRARAIAYMPQERIVHWAIPCLDVVLLGRLPHRSRFSGVSAADLRFARDAMERMDVLAFVRRPFDTLSGGEQARVLIARMLAQDPLVYIADEPVNGLDPAHQIGLMQTFRHLASEGRTVFLSLHDLTLAGRWCDRILLLEDGRLRSDGAPTDTLTEHEMADVYGIRTVSVEIDGTASIVPAGLASRSRDETIGMPQRRSP